MSLHTLPLLFINLGGEMIYILDQRLRAQNIPQEKAKKVIHDIVGTMFNRRFMTELFKPQELYSKKALRTVFDKLAHASIMRLNSASMDKLYDLMTMAFKYQVTLSTSPSEVLLVTLNHMDAIRNFVGETAVISDQVNNVYTLLNQNYGNFSLGAFQLIRQTLLTFFQDMHIRVSIFLKDKVQNSNGRFAIPTSGPVPPGTEIPGLIRLFNDKGEQVKTVSFASGGNYTCPLVASSIELHGNRVTRLGTNMYTVTKPFETTVSRDLNHRSESEGSDVDRNNPNPLAKAELNLLSQLIGLLPQSQTTPKSEFRINLFNTDEEEEEYDLQKPDTSSQVIKIDASKGEYGSTLDKMVGEMSMAGAGADSSSKGDDLLSLMDSIE
ncbi:PREDICTED: protein OSCP1-like [Priapulus caudatus]|uniref:Protein OSCP1-like n=1 Tax=Priapulus caudatus TaxID=37621 RepID=A0ABM1EQI1_PRICU|nr:PREDICTED: protein OSCP1-like [Priapulus caudatus]